MYFADLTPHHECKIHPDLEVIAIGWLDKRHNYPRGETSEEFRERLFEFCFHSVWVTRGLHFCEFCHPTPRFAAPASRNNRELWMRNAEIRVVYQSKVCAAPNLIYHYVVEHGYKPPDAFIEAVLHGLPPTSAEFAALKDKYWNF
jgi:hypothetical protein